MSLKVRLQDAIKSAMRAKDSQTLQALRLISAGIKQKEIDEQTELDDPAIVTLLSKMAKQRRDAMAQYQEAGRQDLADKEQFELTLIESYLPVAASHDEIQQTIASAINTTGATSVKDMGQVMAIVKDKLAGKADLGKVSQLVKSQLSNEQ